MPKSKNNRNSPRKETIISVIAIIAILLITIYTINIARVSDQTLVGNAYTKEQCDYFKNTLYSQKYGIKKSFTDMWNRDCAKYYPTQTPKQETGAGASVTNPLTPEPQVKGNFDPLGCKIMGGWTCDLSAPEEPLQIKVYDGTNTNGKWLFGISSNIPAEKAVCNACGGKCNHRFSFEIPSSIKDGRTHELNLYAVDSDGKQVLLGTRTFSSLNCLDTAKKIGFDQGMKIAAATTGNPDSELYYEDCSAIGGCKQLPLGAGFYTLFFDWKECKLNAGGTYYEGEYNQNVPCPYAFRWKKENDALIAHLAVDTSKFTSSQTKNVYFGLQTNTAYGSAPYSGPGSLHGGLSYYNATHAPPIGTVQAATLKVRAKVCDVPSSDAMKFGRVIYYVNWANPAKATGFGTLSFNLFTYEKGVDTELFPDTYETEANLADLSLDSPNYENYKRTFHINAQRYGITPNGAEIFVDTTPDCSTPLSTVPWTQITVPVQSMFDTLIAEGSLSKDDLKDAKYTGGIIAGVEQWGRLKMAVEVKEHVLYRTG